MAGNSGDIKGKDLLQAFIDLVILVLLMIGAGFGGYWYGIHERLAPINAVGPGTPGALPATAVTPATGTTTTSTPTATTTSQTPGASSSTPTTSATPTPAAAPAGKKQKFWLASTGQDMVGYQIVVSINDHQVDGFTGPDKLVDVTKWVKHGENNVEFDAKYLGAQYNKHKKDAGAKLTVQLVHGPSMTDSFNAKDVLLTYTRNATEDQPYDDTLTFTDGD